MRRPPPRSIRTVTRFPVTTLVRSARFAEYTAAATELKDKAISAWEVSIATAEKREAEVAELAKLRAEAEERARKDREDRIAREAAEAAKADRKSTRLNSSH